MVKNLGQPRSVNGLSILYAHAEYFGQSPSWQTLMELRTRQAVEVNLIDWRAVPNPLLDRIDGEMALKRDTEVIEPR